MAGYDIVVKHALSRPDVRFRLIADGKEVINAPSGTLRSRAGDVLGRRVAHDMGEVNGEDEGIRVTGLVSRPEETRSSQSSIHLFVNDRPVRDYPLSGAIVRAYSGLIFGGRFPIAVIFVQLPFEEVDVNVHPTKREVKFRDPKTVGGVVYRAVEAAVRRAHEGLGMDAAAAGVPARGGRRRAGSEIGEGDGSGLGGACRHSLFTGDRD